MKWLSVTLLAAIVLIAPLGCSTPRARGPLGRDGMNALWVTRWDYKTRADVEEAIDNAAWLGATDIIWQMRGQADAFYPSDLEPWGEELLVGGSSPDFDPLDVAVARAHDKGIRIHAWMNVFPLWKGKTPPKSRAHPFYTHDEWRLRDNEGNPQLLNDHYVIVNPVLPAVQRHIVAVVRDVTERYDVDGIHLDYVRFVSDTMKDASVYPGDGISPALFEAGAGADGLGPDGKPDPGAFRAWIRDEITEVVTRLRSVTDERGVMLTAAVWRRPELARERYMQDAARWINDGTIDYAMPMMYTDDDDRFADDLAAWRPVSPAMRIVPGIGNYKHAPPQTYDQIRLSEGSGGVAIFAYASLFESARTKVSRERARRRRPRRARRDSLKAAFGGKGAS